MNLPVSGTSVGIIGGSIAGCGVAIALQRVGCDVTVFERSSGSLRDRGAGIAIPIPLRDELVKAGYLESDYPVWEMNGRRWIIKDGDNPGGKALWHQAGSAVANNWSVLWQSLRSRVPDDRYFDNSVITGMDVEDNGVAVKTADGVQKRFDVVLGADGYRSLARNFVDPTARPVYSGYILWRGNYSESLIEDRSLIDEMDKARDWSTVVFKGGHGVFYMIPDSDGPAEIGQRRVNWAVYAPQPSGLDFSDPSSIPPGAVSAELYGEFKDLLDTDFPAYFKKLVELNTMDEVSIQPIYDQAVGQYVKQRVALIGDAGTVTRPHTGSGATKALQDALSLERLCDEFDDWDSVLAQYNSDRVSTGNSIVELGRRIGRAQVEETPDWANMGPDDFDAWTKATLSGEKLYFYGDQDEK